MADQAELAFIRSFAASLASSPVQYPDDYRQPPENSLRRVPVIPIEVPPPPKRVEPTASTSASGTLTITLKSLKPPHSFTLAVSPADPIGAIKAQLAAQPAAPPADAQRLLLRGKALADAKLLQEYGVKDGDTLTLAVKPGFAWDPAAPAPPAPDVAMSDPAPQPERPPPPPLVTMTPPSGADAIAAPAPGRRGHTRIPSVVLSPSPSSTSPLEEKPADIPLTFDTSAIPTASEQAGPPRTTYHATIADPGFWARLNAFLQGEFARPEDAADAFEDFLRASKGVLTPHEIAKIRDHVGIIGMAGK